MNKILAIIGILVLALLGYGLYSMITGSKNAEESNKERNPIFHTVPEGSACRPGEGDCETGLTCGEGNLCVKP